MKTTLTVEESARLIELGVDPKMASTTCINFNGTYAYVSGEESETVRDCVNGQYYTEECSCFTLADILSILPKEIKVDKVNLSLVMEWQCDKWYVCYMGPGYMKAYQAAPELIDALYSLFIWCLEQKIIKLKEN